ncbi:MULTISPECIES: ABC1 kinase family protein [Caproicibacterium]|uniref:AarF/UbiB family protein n=1 Tax=Caproicibacterium argilliputei TaxID=3030016 RepID=A0AA97D6A2_9FIRM|nr:AarF/UbiB family protein [Caproicibacterium argilliputei]WOC31159.1 AarF/UbiB family protein [Caproicibacterium argilliputei]
MNTSSGSSSARLRELLNVLRRHNVLHGLTPETLRRILEDLGPTYVKLGQIMSMRSDILPREYCKELEKLRATVHPVPFSEISEMLRQEYGCPISQIFSNMDETPLGSASIAQVYKAVLKETGQKVVVKVQRPGIHDTMQQDVRLMHKAVRLLNRMGAAAHSPLDFNAVIDEMWAVAQQEMNFLQEAEHMQEFSRLNREIAYVTCPQVNRRLSTERVLVMEYIDGIPVDSTERLTQLGYDMEEIGTKLVENFSKQVLDDAFFHADPHPGNVWICGGKIVFLDFGMIGRITRHDQQILRSMFRAVAEHDVHRLEEGLLTIGTARRRIDHARLYDALDELLRKYGDTDLSEIDLGKALQELFQLATAFEIAIPSGFTMLGRGVLTLEGVIAKCCPTVSLTDIITTHLAGEFTRQIDVKQELLHAGKALYGSLHSGLRLPTYLANALKTYAKGHTKLNLEIVGSEELLDKLDRMINKLVVCLIAASLLLGSSILCNTNMKPQIFGLPALGLLGFLIAFILCAYLLLSILHNSKDKKR